MENETANPMPSWPQSAYTRAYAAAAGAGLASENHSLGQSVPTSFVGEQISDLADPDRSLFAGNTCVSHVDDGHYNAYEPLATPGHWSNADPWPTVDAEQHPFAPFVNSNPFGLTEGAFAAGTAFSDAIALPTAPNPYTWGPTVPQGPMDEFFGANSQYPDPSLSMMDPFTAGTNGDPYQGLFPANSHQVHFPAKDFRTQYEAAVVPPNTFNAIDADAIPFDTAQSAPTHPTCATCNRPFKRRTDLDRHAKIHQADAKVFKCKVEDCAYSSYRKDKLCEHVRRRRH